MANPKIVHKQFNSPLGLYSQQNINETLSKHLQNLDNGTVGIDFNQPGTDKPANLANSAVLRMLEEEERNRRGYPKLEPTQVKAILDTMVHMNHRFDRCWPPERARVASARSWDGQLNNTCNIYSDFLRATKGQKKVVWPPVPETNGYHQPQPQQRAPIYNAPQSPQQKQQQQYQPQEIQIPVQHYHTQPSQPSPQYQSSPAQNYEKTPSYQSASCEGRRQEPCGLSKLIPVGPGASPVPQYRGPASPGVPLQAPLSPRQQPQSNRWAPVAAPLSPQTQGTQPSYPQQSYSPQPPFSPQYKQPEPLYHQRQFEPPATTITLRQQQPVHQKPAPVYASQPVAASYNGGVNMRGDNKWPPQSVREAVAAENDARRQLAKGPACRPRKVKKDYAAFFAQNALNHNYPGYRAPPGTQHYEELSGRTSY